MVVVVTVVVVVEVILVVVVEVIKISCLWYTVRDSIHEMYLVYEKKSTFRGFV